MKALIDNSRGEYTDDFLFYVKTKMREYFYSHIKSEKLEPFEIFINEAPEYKSILKKYISAYDICIIAIYNIVTIKYGENIVLTIDENTIIPNTSIKLIDLCKLINKGNLVLKPYPIFTEVFDYVKNNIEDIYVEYILE